MSSENPDKDKPNVHHYRRKKLEPEIAAMSVQDLDKEENPTVIVNVDHPGAKAAIKKVIVSIGVIAGGIAESLRQAISKHTAVVALAGATAIVYATAEVSNPHPPSRRAPDAIHQTVHVPASPAPTPTRPAAIRPTPTPSHTSTVAPASEQRPPTRHVQHSRSAPPTLVSVSVTDHLPEPSTRPTRRQPPTPTPERTQQRAHLPTPTVRPSPSRNVNSGARIDVDLPTPSRRPAREIPLPKVSVSVGIPPVPVSVGCVKVDPLLDLCLLG